MLIKTYKFFNQLTRQALLDSVNGYVDKSKSVTSEINKLRGKFGIKKIYRFDLGENADGFSPKINEYLRKAENQKVLFEKLNEYPNVTHIGLRQQLAEFYHIDRKNIVLSTGLDSILDLITRVFFDYNDVYLMPVPDFFLFESYSERMGGMPIFLPLSEENNFCWTEKTIHHLCDLIERFRPKIVWLSNPSNPSGQVIPPDTLEQIIKIAYDNNVFIVIDEAYGEFFKDANQSAIQFIHEYENLMVLRTFSKAYGLAGIRLGYLISSSKDIIQALLMHRNHFPVTQFALKTASLALTDQKFIQQTVVSTEYRRQKLFQDLLELKTFRFIPSTTNNFMLKNKFLTDEKLHLLLKQKGIYTSLLRITGIEKQNYLRVTIRSEEDNHFLVQKCHEIEKEIAQSINIDSYSLNYS
jgi:histidinol-phosphate aminotransferase